MPTDTPADIPVRFDPSIAGNVPVIFAAGILVKLAALAAGSVAGNLAFGIVPEAKSDASKYDHHYY